MYVCSLPLNNLHSTKTLCPYHRTYAQSNELIEWQTGKLFAYLTLRNSRINVTFRNRYEAGPSCANIVSENKTFIGCFLNSYQIC